MALVLNKEYPYLVFIWTAPRYVQTGLIRHVHALGCLWAVLVASLAEHREVPNLRAPTERGGATLTRVGVVLQPLEDIE